MPRAKALGYYEVVKIGAEWCLRIRETKRPVAWSKKDDAAWQAYCKEAEEAAQHVEV